MPPIVRYTYPPFTTPFGAEVTEVLIDGAGCHWTQNADGKWKCTPRKGGDCDKGWIDDGCRVERSIFGEGLKFTVEYKCMCMNSVQDAR